MNLMDFMKNSRINAIRRAFIYNKRKYSIEKNARKCAEEKYYSAFDRIPDLDHPKTFNEKVLWISLYYHNPIYTQCADKVDVKHYLEDKLGEKETQKLICQRYGVWDNPDDIDFDSLPDSFVLKSNHASGQFILCRDKKKLDIQQTKRVMKNWLKINYYYASGEWQYKNIKPKIICEKLLESDIVDYRIFCFEGKPTYIKTTRHNTHSTGGYDCALYYPDWTPTEFRMSQNYGEMTIEKPKRLDYMLSVATKLSQDFHFVRVDLYSVENEIYFAELTFTPNSGREKFDNESVDERFGAMFDIPNDEYVEKDV